MQCYNVTKPVAPVVLMFVRTHIVTTWSNRLFFYLQTVGQQCPQGRLFNLEIMFYLSLMEIYGMLKAIGWTSVKYLGLGSVILLCSACATETHRQITPQTVETHGT